MEITNTEAMVQPDEAPQTWTNKLPQLMRGFGAAAILYALYSFMMQGWDSSSDLLRYMMLLCGTALLTIVALACGHYLKEGKSPRVLMMLALTAVAVNFSILGAFVFSTISPESSAIYPTYVSWSVGSINTAMLTTLGSAAVLLFVVIIGFRTLVRSVSSPIVAVFAATNLLILLPVRDPVVIATLSMLATILVTFSLNKLQNTPVMKTAEGVITQVLLFTPIGILLGRNIWLYDANPMLVTIMTMIGFMLLRQSRAAFSQNSIASHVIVVVSVILALFSGISTGKAITLMPGFTSFAIMFSTLIAGSMIYELSTRAGHLQHLIRILASAIITLGISVNVIGGELLNSICAIAVGLSMIYFSAQYKQRALLIAGVALMLLGFIEQLLHLNLYFDFGYWVSLAVAGVVAIVAASIIESKGSALKSTWVRYKTQLDEWDY